MYIHRDNVIDYTKGNQGTRSAAGGTPKDALELLMMMQNMDTLDQMSSAPNTSVVFLAPSTEPKRKR